MPNCHTNSGQKHSRYSSILCNLSFTSTVPGMMLSQVWSGKKPSVNNLKVFRFAPYSHIPKDERGNLSLKTWKSIFLGYIDVTKGYRLFDPIKDCVIHSQDVLFVENSLGIKKEQVKILHKILANQLMWALKPKVMIRQKKQMRRKRSKPSGIMRITLRLMMNHQWYTLTFRTHSIMSRFLWSAYMHD